MEKTKLGVSVGVFGAFVYAATFFGGYVAAILLAGYVLLVETNEWLKKASIKALATLVFFNFITFLVGLIPEVLNWVTSTINIFGTNLYFSLINDIFGAIGGVIGIVKDLVFAGLIYKALNQGTIKISVIDNLINRNM